MGNCAVCVKRKQPQENPPPQGIVKSPHFEIRLISLYFVKAEEEIVVLNNRDGYFSKDDMAAIAKKYPEYKEWEKISKETALEQEPKEKPRKIRWKEGEVLGHGSFGRVVFGLNRNTGEVMAVKQVYLGGFNSEIIQDRIKALEVEIDLLSQFSHKNIVRYIGSTRTKESFNIFLEYIAGGTIASLVAKYGPFNEKLIKVYTKQILEGLEYLHARNIIHRDIKGANVLADNNGLCKLADFGSAKNICVLLSSSALHSLKGTANWMPPEVIMQRGLSRYSDIWSVGCVVIEMATSKPPWSGANQMATMFQIAKAKTPPPFPSDLSPDCQDFLKLCLKVNPKERANVTALLQHKFLKDADQFVKESNLLTEQLEGVKNRLSASQLKNLRSVASSLKSLDGISRNPSNGSMSHLTPKEEKELKLSSLKLSSIRRGSALESFESKMLSQPDVVITVHQNSRKSNDSDKSQRLIYEEIPSGDVGTIPRLDSNKTTQNNTDSPQISPSKFSQEIPKESSPEAKKEKPSEEIHKANDCNDLNTIQNLEHNDSPPQD